MFGAGRAAGRAVVGVGRAVVGAGRAAGRVVIGAGRVAGRAVVGARLATGRSVALADGRPYDGGGTIGPGRADFSSSADGASGAVSLQHENNYCHCQLLLCYMKACDMIYISCGFRSIIDLRL